MSYWDDDYGYSGGYYDNWFKKTKKSWINSWRPKFVQPDAACFVQDGWTQRQGDSAVDRAPTNTFEDSRDAGDFFTVAFEVFPEFAKHTSRPIKRAFCKALIEHPMYAAMRSQTRLDVTASHVAAESIANIYKQFASQEQEANKRGKGGQGAGANKKGKSPSDGEGDGDEGEDGKEGRDTSDGLTDEQRQQVEQAAQQAIDSANKEIEDSQQFGQAFGTRAGTGAQQASEQDQATFLKLYGKYKVTSWLRRMVKYAGRMRQIARARQKGRAKTGADSFRGVEAADSVERLLPEEFMLLGDDVMEYDVLQRLIEGNAQCLETFGNTDAGSGPIILAVDESGSMGTRLEKGSGKGLTRFQQAMGVALTVAWIARAQRRWVGLYTFQGGPHTRKLIMDPNDVKPSDSNELMNWVCKFSGGGTDACVVTQVIPTDVRKGLLSRVRGQTDLLVISDGDFDGSYNAEEFKKWKKEYKVKVKGLLIGTADAGALKILADENHFANDMDESSSVAEAVFSL